MTSGVYAIVNKEHGKRYIGSSCVIERRWNEHKRKLRLNRHHSPHLQNAWNKYGEGCFDFIVIQECSRENLLKYEQYYLDEEVTPEYNTYPFASIINMTDDAREKRYKLRLGRPHPHKGDKGRIVGRETRDKQSIARKGKTHKRGYHLSEETKAKMSIASTGRGIGNKYGLGNKSKTGQHPSAETLIKMSIASTGRGIGNKHGVGNKSRTGQHPSPEHIAKMSAMMMGNTYRRDYLDKQPIVEKPPKIAPIIKLTSEGKRMQSLSLKGRIFSEEHRRNLSIGKTGKTHKGTPLSQEHKAKLSASKKGKKLPPFSEEHRRKLSISSTGNKSNLGHLWSPERRKEASKNHTGKPHPHIGHGRSVESIKKSNETRKKNMELKTLAEG